MPLTLASAERRSYTAPLVVAAAVLVAVIAATFWFNPHHTGSLTATHTDVFAPVTTFKLLHGGSINVLGQAPETEQNLYVVVTLRVQNDLRVPIYLDEVDGTYAAANGGQITVTAPAADNLGRVQQVFPQLKSLMPHPLLLGDAVPPKSAVEGQVLFPFNGLGADAWKTRKPSTLTLHLLRQQPMTVSMP